MRGGGDAKYLPSIQGRRDAGGLDLFAPWRLVAVVPAAQRGAATVSSWVPAGVAWQGIRLMRTGKGLDEMYLQTMYPARPGASSQLHPLAGGAWAACAKSHGHGCVIG